MTDTAGPTPDDGATPALRICTTIEREQVERLRIGLAAAFHAVLMAGRTGKVPDEVVAAIQERHAKNMARNAWLLPVIGWLSAAGLAVCIAFAADGGIYWDGYRLDTGFAMVFVAFLALFILLRRLRSWKPTPFYGIRKPLSWLLKAVAGRLAARTLGTVRKLAPFDARYDFKDGTVTCTRITTHGNAVAWQRPLAGWRVAGNGFTLVFKDRTSLQCFLVMHEPCAELDELLARHGVLPFPEP